MTKKEKDSVNKLVTRISAETFPKFLELAEKRVNTLLTGPHGIGKTSLFFELCQKLGWKGAYINVPSADFFVDWLGIPAPTEAEPECLRMIRWLANRGNTYLAERFVETSMGLRGDDARQMVAFVQHQPVDQKSIEFLRPKRLEGVQFVFFDELNRESDPRFTDACMELVQFRTINGQPLPDLQVVWAAQNPPNSVYKVKELDVPLIDKFGAHLYIDGCADYNWLISRGYRADTVSAVLQWAAELSPEQKKRTSPRFLESVIRLADAGVDPDFALLRASGIPGHVLAAKLRKVSTSHKFAAYTLPRIISELPSLQESAKTDFDFCAFYTSLLLDPQVNSVDVLRTVPLFMHLSFEWQSKCLGDKQFRDRMSSVLQSLSHLPPDVHSVSGIQLFSELLRQFSSRQ